MLLFTFSLLFFQLAIPSMFNHATSFSKIPSCLLCHFPIHYSYFTLGLDQFDPFNSRVPNIFPSPLSLWYFFSVLVIFGIWGVSNTQPPPPPKKNTTKIGKKCELCYLPTNAPCNFRDFLALVFLRKPFLQIFHIFLVFLFCLLLSSLSL